MREYTFVIYIMLILVKQINKCYKYDSETGYKRAFIHSEALISLLKTD